MTSVLVTGATGTLGRHVVRLLADTGHTVHATSRRPRRPDAGTGVRWFQVDLVTGEGLLAALSGVDAVVHAASDPRHPRADVPAARNLVDAAGGAHIVYISIVGVDVVPLPYYKAKLAVERIIEASPRRTILRTTQFHDLVAAVARVLGRSPVVPSLSGTRVQPVDAGEVAARLVELALGVPVGRAPDLGGPRVEDATELIRAYFTARGKRRLVVPVRLPGKTARAYRDGGHLAPDGPRGTRTFEEYLRSLDA